MNQHLTMTETITLRNKPTLKLMLHSSSLEIVDSSDPKNNGTYAFNDIKNAKVKAESTDWFVSILSYILDLFVSSALGGNFKNKAHLTLDTDDGTLKIWLVDADLQQAEKVAQLINAKTNGTQQNV